MKEPIDFKIVWQEFKESFKDFYPYFLVFYIVSVAISFFSFNWKAFFYWPAFNIVTIIFTALFIYITTKQVNLKGWSSIKINFNSKKIVSIIAVIIKFCWGKFSTLSRATLIKIIIIIAALIFSLYHQIDLISFLILAFGLISVLAPVDNRWSAVVALIFLASCPLLLITKNDILAEKSAIFAYYLLVISVLSMIHLAIKDSFSNIS